jgi:transcription factor STE12
MEEERDALQEETAAASAAVGAEIDDSSYHAVSMTTGTGDLNALPTHVDMRSLGHENIGIAPQLVTTGDYH